MGGSRKDRQDGDGDGDGDERDPDAPSPGLSRRGFVTRAMAAGTLASPVAGLVAGLGQAPASASPATSGRIRGAGAASGWNRLQRRRRFDRWVQAAGGSRTWVVDQGSRVANDRWDGTELRPLETISEAALHARPGDTVLVHAGVYRERVAPRFGGEDGRPITYVAADGEDVWIKGSDIWEPGWETTSAGDGIYFGPFASDQFAVDQRQADDWGDAFPTEYNPYEVPLALPPGDQDLVLGQLILDGDPRRQVASLDQLAAHAGSWYAARSGRRGLYVNFGFPPEDLADRLLELTVRPRCFAPYRRRLEHIHVRGFRMAHGATNYPFMFWMEGMPPQAGILSARSGSNWVIEGNEVRYGNSVGIDIGREGAEDADGLGQGGRAPAPDNTVRNNVVSDNGSNGIVGGWSHGSHIVGNRIERNNRLGFTGHEIGGIKMHHFERGLIADNLVRDNHCYGIWLDQQWQRARITRNALIGNQGAGLFIELGVGPLQVDSNVIAMTHARSAFAGDGIYSHDSSGVVVAHNLVFRNEGYALFFHKQSDRQVGGDGGPDANASDWHVCNNIMVRNGHAAMSFPMDMEGVSEGNESDHNVFAANRPGWVGTSDGPIFTVNTNVGRGDVDDLVARVESGIDDPADRPNMERWRRLPFLLLDEWRAVTGRDEASAVADPRALDFATASDGDLLIIAIDDSPARVNARPVDEVVDKGERVAEIMTDYLGAQMPDDPLAGPFQALSFDPDDPSQIILWPRGIDAPR